MNVCREWTVQAYRSSALTSRIDKYRDGFALYGSAHTTLLKKSSDEERKERLNELGPMVLEIINAPSPWCLPGGSP